ncbi:uncharacterized protein A1O9_01740 [Exophiala aquamarina CBS 119918]|uniref:Uncharacterized protein n=1 Tax=Exophiala aquamarina CBS 119918 TaxID=1182545 RepID=A0A072PVN0_9EURO|nr:uncharacterized protein A1O9_01740 [Exophiala aquamarina CBS 119918]KEF63762.1 hypothetical protein A1O9_01740 [Exophiala aquamarina CBS 119918]
MPSARARNGRRGNDSKSANPNRSTAGSRDGTPGAGQSKRGGKTGPGVNRSADTGAQNGPATLSALPSSDEHVPLAGFNPDAVDAALKQGFESKAPLFKPEAKPQTTKTESPWGVKAGAMTSGKDFWLDLRKQVFALQQSGGTSQGG